MSHVRRHILHLLKGKVGMLQAKKSWTDTAKQGIVGGLGYTQSGLEYVKNKVGGPTGPTGTGNTGTGNTGSSYSTGQPTTGTTTNPNQRY